MQVVGTDENLGDSHQKFVRGLALRRGQELTSSPRACGSRSMFCPAEGSIHELV
jgi:hypothetical protein